MILQKRELEQRLKEPYIERAGDAVKLENPLIKVIIGPRRAGKSFFAIHFLNKCGNFGYVNFDDELLVEAKDYDEIMAAVNTVYNNPKYILFDEIQNLPKWELFANRLQRQGYNLIITGSNAKLLSMELSTHLTGRHILMHIMPFSFKEFIRMEGKELTSYEIKEKLDAYVACGGYPEPLIKHLEYKEYIKTLFNAILYKDIVKRHKIRFVHGLEDLAAYLLSNIATEYSYNALSKVTRCHSPHTVEKYLGYLEETFLVFSIGRYSFRMKEQVLSNKKIYCIDNGIINALAFKISPNTGKLYENVVAAELKKRENNGDLNVYYWKNQQQEEVDFVVKKGLSVTELIQVCYDISNLGTKNREIRSLLKAGKDLKCANLLIITGDFEGEEQAEWFGIKGKIKYTPIWRWLLAK